MPLDRTPTGDARAKLIFKELLDAFPHVRSWMKRECRDVSATRELWVSAITGIPIDAVDKASSQLITGEVPLLPEFKNNSHIPQRLAKLAKSIVDDEPRKAENRELLEKVEKADTPPPSMSSVQLIEARRLIEERVCEEIPHVERDERERRVQKEFAELVKQAFARAD